MPGIYSDLINPLKNFNTLEKMTLDPPFTPYVGKYDGTTGLILFMSKYGEIGVDNRITGLEYCPTDDTIIISGYGVSYTPE